MGKVMIIGAGFMGTGIAQVCAQTGYQVKLIDNRKKALRAAGENISDSLQKMFSRGQLSEHPPAILERIRYEEDYADAAKMQWIIEAVTEKESIKRHLLIDLDRMTDAEVPLASNTSSIPISLLAKGLRYPERLLGLHFFGPVPLMELVEVIQSSRTSNAIFERGIAFVRALGKHPVRVGGDIPGFVMNRVFAAAFRECLELVTAGVACVEDIDAGMRLGYGWKAGPFEIADNAGIDTILNVSRSLKSLGEHHLAADTDVLEKMVARGRLGRKSGRGFYSYDVGGRKKAV